MIDIDRHVPLPTHVTGIRSYNPRPRYPFKDMSVGDSFYAPGRRPHQVKASLSYWGRKLNHSYIIAPEPGGTRIWRTR